jgi:TPR repeat protein
MPRFSYPLRAIAFAIALTTGAVAGPYEDGVAANKAGDPRKALELWLPLAEQGHVKAQFGVAAMYDMGKGVAENRAEAAKWYRRAAEQGDVGAQFAIGSAYSAGDGVSRDYLEAAKWFRRAAEQGDGTSQLILGGMYALGQGLEKDLVESLKWLTLATKTSFIARKAIENRDAVASVMSPEQISEAQRRAVEWKPKLEQIPR